MKMVQAFKATFLSPTAFKTAPGENLKLYLADRSTGHYKGTELLSFNDETTGLTG